MVWSLISFVDLKIWLSKDFSMNNMEKETCILEIKIYRDIIRRLLILSQSIYIDMMLKSISIEEFKIDFSILHKIHLFKDLCLKNKLKEMIKMISYTSSIRFIIYMMLFIIYVSHAMSITSRYQSCPSKGH